MRLNLIIFVVSEVAKNHCYFTYYTMLPPACQVQVGGDSVYEDYFYWIRLVTVWIRYFISSPYPLFLFFYGYFTLFLKSLFFLDTVDTVLLLKIAEFYISQKSRRTKYSRKRKIYIKFAEPPYPTVSTMPFIRVHALKKV